MSDKTTFNGWDTPPKYKILALFGKSSAGKNTIQQWMINNIPNTKEIVSCTTRPQRDYEIDGKDYHFINEEELAFKLQQGLMLETTSFRDWHYGTSIEELSSYNINIGVFNIQGIEDLLADGRVKVLPVLIDAPARTRLERSFNREKNPDYAEICRRFLADEEDFKKIPFNYAFFKNSQFYNDYFNIQNIPAIKDFLQDKND